MPVAIQSVLRFSTDQYFPIETEKSGICVHQVVDASARSRFDLWRRSAEKVGVAYLIDRDGAVFELFPPRAWAFQFDLSWPDAARITFEKRFVGIEIACEGGEVGADQVATLINLINHLCDSLGVPRQVPEGFEDYYGETLRDFKGVIADSMVRPDEGGGLLDEPFWEAIVAGCGLTVVSDADAIAPPQPQGMTPAQIEALFEANVQAILRMNTAAGSMVKGLIQELCRGDRDTYIELHDPVADGHLVSYRFRHGDESLVGRIGRALGLTITADRIEVPSR